MPPARARKSKVAPQKVAAPVAAVRPPRSLPVSGAALLLLLVVLAYAPAFQNGFVWDDDDYVTANRTLRSWDGLRRIWAEPGAVPQYYPLTFTSLWVDYRLWGAAPVGYHMTNVLLHALNAVLLWRILVGLGLAGAWAAAAVFALHPVHVESVAWVTERKNVLSGTLYLGALLAYLRFLEAPAGGPRPWGRYALAVALFVGAMLAKTVTCTLPVVILLLVWWRPGRVGWRDVVPLVPLFAVGLALGLVTVWMERHHVGARGVDWQLSLVDRCLVAGRALWFYAGKLVWPHPLVFNYPRWEIDATAWSQYLFPLAVAAVVGGLALAQARIGKAPLVAVLFFVVTLGPALGFVDVFPMRYSFVADHFQYLASIGLIVLGVATAVVPARRRGPAAAQGLRAVGAVGLVLLGVLTWRQTLAYRDLRTLWTDVLAKNPGSWMAHNNLGLLLADRGRIDDAVAHYAAALAVKPDDSFAHNNLGNALASQGKLAEAITHFQAAVRIDPVYAEAHNNLGNALAATGRTEEALGEYQAALRVRPAYADAYSNLAAVLAGQGKTAEAMAACREAVRLDPEYPEAHFNLGLLLADAGQPDEAVRQLSLAVRLRPAYAAAHYQLGRLLTARGNAAEAAAHLREAVRLDPANADARRQLGLLVVDKTKALGYP